MLRNFQHSMLNEQCSISYAPNEPLNSENCSLNILFPLDQFGVYDPHIFERAVAIFALAGCYRSNFVYYIQSSYYFTKHCIALVEVRGTPESFVNFALLSRDFSSIQAICFNRIQTRIGKNFPLYNIELAATTGFFRVVVS